MSRQRETNPHFIPHHHHHLQLLHSPKRPPSPCPPSPWQQSRTHKRNESSQPLYSPRSPTPPQTPSPHQTPRPLPTGCVPYPHQTQTQTPPPHHGPETYFPPHRTNPPPVHPPHPSSNVRMPHRSQTGTHTWLIGVLCAVFWIAVFLGGLVVLIVYLVCRPRGPKFDISEVSLNVAYIDMGYLNADMTILANFTNPSKKATVDFNYMVVNLYYRKTLISTSYVESFKAMKAESLFRNVRLVSSQVVLPPRESQQMRQQIVGNIIRFEVKGLLRARSNLGSLFRYSNWLYGHCIIEVTGPPSGVLVGKKCTTKR